MKMIGQFLDWLIWAIFIVIILLVNMLLGIWEDLDIRYSRRT